MNVEEKTPFLQIRIAHCPFTTARCPFFSIWFVDQTKETKRTRDEKKGKKKEGRKKEKRRKRRRKLLIFEVLLVSKMSKNETLSLSLCLIVFEISNFYVYVCSFTYRSIFFENDIYVCGGERSESIFFSLSPSCFCFFL